MASAVRTAPSADGLEFAISWPRAVEVAYGLWQGDAERRAVVRDAEFAAAAFVTPAMRAMAPVEELLAGTGQPDVDNAHVEMIRRVTTTFLGRCWAALRRPMRAITALETVLRSYEDTHGRDKALYLSFLADAYVDANEVEQACTVASRAMDLSAGVASTRPRQRIESVIRRLDGSEPYVVELRAKAAEWASLRQLSAAPTPGTELIPPVPAPR